MTTTTNLYNGTSVTSNLCTASGSSLYDGVTWNPKPKKTHKQVKVAIFFVTRDENYEIIDSSFDQEFWVCQKNGVSLEAATMMQLGYVIDPDVKIIREVSSLTI